ncbi:MAG TPA: hypothetical protein VGN12_20605 [Pirellulales bacterium]|jgi:hypothetical protein
MVEKTVMVPKMETETRKVNVTEYTNETRERTITVMQRVPKTETVTHNYTAMVPKTETKTVTYNVCKPVVTDETQEYTVCVPHTETREGTRKVCKVVPVTKTRTVTVDEGHWEQAAPASNAAGCGDCGTANGCDAQSSCCDSGCGRRRLLCRRSCGSACDTGNGCGTAAANRVWVSNPVQKEVTYTVCETIWEDKHYTCNVTVMKPETRTRTVQKRTFVMEPQTREVTYTKCVAEQRTMTRDVTRYECVPTEKTLTCTVRVPHQVEKEVQVQVCKMVPKTIMVPAGSDSGCGTAECGGSGLLRGRRCRGC